MAKGDEGGGGMRYVQDVAGGLSGLGSSANLYGGGGVGPSANIAQTIQDVMSGVGPEEEMTPFQRMLMEYDRSRMMEQGPMTPGARSQSYEPEDDMSYLPGVDI